MRDVGEGLMRMILAMFGYHEPPEHDARDRQRRVTEATSELKNVGRKANLAALQAQATVSDGWRRIQEHDHGREQEWRNQ